MLRGDLLANYLIYLALLALGCLVDAPWISVPAALILLLWIPGWALRHILTGIGATPGRVWLIVASSLVLMPVPLNWLWQVSNNRFFILISVVLIDLVLMVLAAPTTQPVQAPPMFPQGAGRRVFAGLVCWMAASVFASFWIPRQTVAYTTPAHDYAKHHAVMLSLQLYPLPLHNMLCAVESDAPYYYYHYPYLVPAALRTLTGNRVSIALAFGLTSAVLAAVLMALVFLHARDLIGSIAGALLAVACVSVVGGFDIIPVLAERMRVVTLDAWCPVGWRIHNFATQYLWCPQHVSVVVAVMLCAYWLRHAPDRSWWVIMAPLISASILGGSVYLAMVMFPAAAVYMLHRLWRARAAGGAPRSRLLPAVGGMVLIGLALMGEQAWHYRLTAERYGGGLTVQWDRFPLALLGRLVPPGPLANLLDAPWILLIDLGLTGIACLLVSRRWWAVLWADAGARLVVIAGVLGAAALFTIRSSVHPFDYGFRIALMPAMPLMAVCVGALLHAEWLRPFARRWARPVVGLGVVLGLPVGLYEVPVTATRTAFEYRTHGRDPDTGAILFLRKTPRHAVVQGDPVKRLRLAELIDRQLGVLDPGYAHVAVFRPPDLARQQQAFADAKEAFSTHSSSLAYEKLRACGVEYVLAGKVEREHFGEMAQFRDPRWFEVVYSDENATVYRLAEQGPAPSNASSPAESR